MADALLADDVAYEAESTVNEEEENAIEDRDASDFVAGLLDSVNAPEDVAGMVEYKGSKVKKNVAIALTHIVDKMKDHFGNDQPPDVSMHISSLSHLPYDEKYKAKSDEPGDRWFSEVSMRYNIGDKTVPFDVIGLDNVYLDTTPKLNKDGNMAQNYGKTWMNLYIPKKTLKRLTDKFTSGTGWKVSSKGMTTDDGQSLVSVVVNYTVEDAPKFYVMAREYDDDDQPTGRVIVSNRGSVQSVYSDVELQQIYKCTVFLAMSMNVLTPLGTTVQPSPSSNSMARLKFTLMSIKAYGIAENVTSVKLGGVKIKSSLFK